MIRYPALLLACALTGFVAAGLTAWEMREEMAPGPEPVPLPIPDHDPADLILGEAVYRCALADRVPLLDVRHGAASFRCEARVENLGTLTLVARRAAR